TTTDHGRPTNDQRPGDRGQGTGDWDLATAQSPIPNPQSPDGPSSFVFRPSSYSALGARCAAAERWLPGALPRPAALPLPTARPAPDDRRGAGSAAAAAPRPGGGAALPGAARRAGARR